MKNIFQLVRCGRRLDSLSGLIFMLFCLFTTTNPLHAQWSNDPAVNTAICTTAQDQFNPRIVGDGAGGAIITWTDNRPGTASDIYAQRIDASGAVKWTSDGVAICTATDNQTNAEIISDGSGGAIITWQDRRNGSYHIYAQRIDASGTVRWTPDGVAICTTSPSQFIPTLTSDGAGGAIITWEHYRTVFDVYAQRVDSSGAVRWTVDGVAICTVGEQFDRYPVVVRSGIGGAIIAWRDYRTGISNLTYVQRIDSSGTVRWTTDGVSLGGNGNEPPIIVSDSAGGAIVAWGDYRSGTNNDIYAQRIDSSGIVQWTAGGDSICTAVHDQRTARMVEDGVGGAVLVWKDERNGTESHIYAQRINGSGTVQWTTNGVPVCTVAGNQYVPRVISDGSTGVEIAWQDNRPGAVGVYAQRLDVSGAAQWTTGGTKVGSSANPPTMVSSGTGGSIIAWADYRSGTNYDIYASEVNATGVLPVELISFSASSELNGVELKWNTATETNNYGFEIERSEKLKVKNEKWERIGFVEGSGTSSSPRDYSYTDKNISAGRYSYRLKQVDRDGKFKYSQSVEVTVIAAPAKFGLEQNFPNPFNPTTTIRYGLPERSSVKIIITNTLGEEVAVLENGEREAGYHDVEWRANVASGIYFYRIDAVSASDPNNRFVQVKKMLLLK